MESMFHRTRFALRAVRRTMAALRARTDVPLIYYVNQGSALMECVADLDVASFVCVATVEALTHAAVVNRPEVLSDKSGVFADEVTRLVVGYLRGP